MYGLIGRIPTTISLYEFARHVGLDLYSFFGLTIKKCPGLENSYTDTCAELWVETSAQGQSRPNRADLTKVLARAEQRIADYAGYWPGPRYVENERHFMKNWDTVISTNYIKVVKTGTRKRTLLFTGNIDNSGSVPMTRTFINVFDTLKPDTIRYSFGEIGTPLNLPDDCYPLLYSQDIDELPTSSGDLDIEKTINEAYLLRPFVVVERTDEIFTIDVPLPAAVKPQIYFSVYPDIRGNIRFLSACDEDNFVDQIALYAETYSKPDGFVKIAKDLCPSCSGSGCDSCDLPSLPVCLVPVSSENGMFRVRPIRNTGTDEDPCWIIDDLESCCGAIANNLESGRTFDNRWACNLFCSRPLELCISYVSSCHDCFGPDCLERRVDECDLLDAIAMLALSNVSIFCDCTCWREILGTYRDEWPLRMKGISRGTVDEEQYQLGIRVGAVEAFLALKHIEGRHRSLRIGMVG